MHSAHKLPDNLISSLVKQLVFKMFSKCRAVPVFSNLAISTVYQTEKKKEKKQNLPHTKMTY